jgi:hypothetical protein
VHSQHRRGPGHVTVRLFQTAGNVAPFKLAPVITKIARVRNQHTAVRFHRQRIPGRLLPPQINGVQFITFGDDGRAFNYILQLADVAGPIVIDQLPQSFGAEVALRQTVTLGCLSREGRCQSRNVFAPVA